MHTVKGCENVALFQWIIEGVVFEIVVGTTFLYTWQLTCLTQVLLTKLVNDGVRKNHTEASCMAKKTTEVDCASIKK